MDNDVGDDEENPVRFMERVCVQIKGQSVHAVIKEITNKTATVELEDKSTRNLRVNELAMLAPKEHDMVLLTGGADV